MKNAEVKPHNSDSSVQRDLEKKIIALLEMQLEFSNAALESNLDVELDFCASDFKIIGEIYSGVDSVKPAQIKKVLTDCFKLVYVQKSLALQEVKKLMVFADERVKEKFEGNSWYSQAIKCFGIELLVPQGITADDLTILQNAKIDQGKAFRK